MPDNQNFISWQPSERIALFIDGASLYASTKALDFDVDYSRLLDYFKSSGRLLRAFYYTAIHEKLDYNPVRPLADWLDYNGYTLVAKYTREFVDNQGRKRLKHHSVAIDIAVDVMEVAPFVDHIILFSGDGDFKRLIEAVQRKGVRTTVISTAHSTPPMISDELRRKVDNFVELEAIKKYVMKDLNTKSRKPSLQPDIDFSTEQEQEAEVITGNDVLPERYRP